MRHARLLWVDVNGVFRVSVVSVEYVSTVVCAVRFYSGRLLTVAPSALKALQ